MFPLVHGILQQGGVAANWWEAGGASGAVAVYQPKGADSLAASYVNLANPGTFDAAPGTAPTWNATDGWIFGGSPQHLTTGIVPLNTYSMIARFSNVTNNLCLAGALGSGTWRYSLFPNLSGVNYGFRLENLVVTPGITVGVLALTPQRGYRNGVADSADFAAPVGNNDAVLRIADRSDGGLNMIGYIQAFAIYDNVLTADQVAAVSTAMAALEFTYVGPLDGIDNLVHIYCPARRWVSSYNDFAIEIMNEDTDAISQFGYTAAGDTDTAAILSWLSGSNGLIRTLPDQISGDHVTQTTKANMPLFVASGQNGRAVGRYNGTSQWLQGAFTNGGQLSQPFNCYLVTQPSDAGVTRFITDSDDTTNRMIIFQSTTHRIQAGAPLVGDAADTAAHIWSALFNGTASQLWIDGTSVAAGDAGAQNADGITIGARFDGGGFFWFGDIATVIVADPNNDTTNREAVQSALGDYYAITIA